MSAFGPGQAYAQPTPVVLTYGGFWIRFVALVIDGILINVVFLALSAAYGTDIFDFDFRVESGTPGYVTKGSALAAFASMVVPAIYTIGFQSTYGATPGKMLFNMHVVRSDTGMPISFGQAFGRYLASFISAFVFFLGFIWAAFDDRKQTWHDKLAGTLVIRRRETTTAEFRV